MVPRVLKNNSCGIKNLFLVTNFQFATYFLFPKPTDLDNNDGRASHRALLVMEPMHRANAIRSV